MAQKRAATTPVAPEPEKRGRGQPAWQPTDKERSMVETMAGLGIPEVDIAKVLGKDPKTIRKHCREELDTGLIKANAKVSESLFKKALGNGAGSVTAIIWWEKTRGGRKETTVQQHQGGGEGAPPIQTTYRHKLDTKSLEKLAALVAPPKRSKKE